MKIYLAARYSRKEEIWGYANELQANGFDVTSTWFTEPHDGGAQLAEVSSATLLGYAKRDLQEIDDADVMVFYSESDQSYNRRGGRHVEFGYALAKDKLVIVVGPYENIFHYGLHHFNNTGDVVRWLNDIPKT